MVSCFRVGGTECSSACTGPSEGSLHYLHYCHHSLASGQETGGGGTQPHPSTENWIKDLLNMDPTHQNKTHFPPQSVSPIRNLPSAFYPYPSESRENENHNHRKLTKLVTWTTALSSSMKLWAMPCRATQDRQVIAESSDKMWFSGEGNGKPLQYSCLENPKNSMKRQKDRTLKDELPRSVGAQYATGEQWRNNSRKN